MTQSEGFPSASRPATGFVSAEEMRRIILQGDARSLVDCAQRAAKELEELGVTSYQLLGLLGDFRRVEVAWTTSAADGREELRRLRPKLALLAKQRRRESDAAALSPLDLLRDIASDAIDVLLQHGNEEDSGKVPQWQDNDATPALTHLVDLFEAIVAYRRQYHVKG